MSRLLGTAVVAATLFAVSPAHSDPMWGGADVAGSAFAWRPLGDARRDWQTGYAVAWGPSLADDEGSSWRFTGLIQFEATMFDSRSWALGIAADSLEAAARLGPFEPEVRAGFVLATVDVIDGEWSGELFSPRAEAGFGVRLGRFRVSLGAQGEYLWRWFGPSVLERGFVVDLRFEKPWHPPRER